MRKIIIPVWIIGIISAFIFGQYVKGTFTDKILGTGEEKFNTVQNSYYLHNEYIPESEMEDYIDEVFNVSDLIAKVRYTGKSDYVQNEVVFHCEVTEVYKGDTSLIGEQIRYVVEPMAIDLNFGFAWGSYVNYMKEGRKYLIFGEPVNCDLNSLPDNLYRSCSFRYVHYFSFSENNDKLIELEPLKTKGYESFFGFYAKNYPDNEFYATTDEALENILKLKEKVMKKLPVLR